MKKIIITILLLLILVPKAYAEGKGGSGECIRRPLKQVVAKTETHGSFFLGIGGVGQDIFYYMFIQNYRGGYRLNKYDIEEVDIFEDTSKPYAYLCNEYSYHQSFDTFNGGWHADIHIPKGSIENTYKIDLK